MIFLVRSCWVASFPKGSIRMSTHVQTQQPRPIRKPQAAAPALALAPAGSTPETAVRHALRPPGRADAGRRAAAAEGGRQSCCRRAVALLAIFQSIASIRLCRASCLVLLHLDQRGVFATHLVSIAAPVAHVQALVPASFSLNKEAQPSNAE